MTEVPVDPRTVMRERAMNLQQYGVVALCVVDVPGAGWP